MKTHKEIRAMKQSRVGSETEAKKTWDVKVQLGRIAVPERIVSLRVKGKDQEDAIGQASVASYEKFIMKFGKDHPILSKIRTVVSIIESSEASDINARVSKNDQIMDALITGILRGNRAYDKVYDKAIAIKVEIQESGFRIVRA